jgi:DNA-binding transcriptional MerR regulator
LDDAAQHPLLDVHQVSKALRVGLKSMPATERTLASSVTPTLLSIGELSERTGVPTTTLRYYDELGLVRPAARAAGRRRYAASAVRDVGVILFFREIGFSLAEIGRFIAGERQCQREMIDHKLAELAEQRRRIEVARTALEHGRQCPASEPMKCSRFWSIVEGRLAASHWKKATHERTDRPPHRCECEPTAGFARHMSRPDSGVTLCSMRFGFRSSGVQIPEPSPKGRYSNTDPLGRCGGASRVVDQRRCRPVGRCRRGKALTSTRLPRRPRHDETSVHFDSTITQYGGRSESP